MEAYDQVNNCQNLKEILLMKDLGTYTFPHHPLDCYLPRPAIPSLFDYLNNISWKAQIMKLFIT